MSDRFDPRPGEPYARCSDCDFVAQSKEDMSVHTSETMKPTGDSTGVTARSHGYRITNPSREDAIRTTVLMEESDALNSAADEFVESIYALHERHGASLRELTEAVKLTEFASAWAEYIAGAEYDDDDDADEGESQLHQETALFDIPEVSK